jgi:hypothetical protein
MRLRCSEGAKPPIASATGFGGSWRSGNQWSNTLQARASLARAAGWIGV